MRTALDLLSQISVASPCTANWDEMVGDANARFCEHCEKNVYNLSALTTEAAIELIREKEGKLCGRFFRRADGTILTADCPVGLHHRVQRKRRFAGLAATCASLLAFTGCTRFDDPSSATTANAEIKVEKCAAVVGEIAPAIAGGICAPPELAGRRQATVSETPELLPMPRTVARID